MRALPVYETRDFWVAAVGSRGFEVYETGATASRKVASIGNGPGPNLGVERAIAECNRRQSERNNARNNPEKRMPTKKPTAKQLAARKRFAEMARSGAFKRKAKAGRKAAPARKTRRANPAPKKRVQTPRGGCNPLFKVQVYRSSAWHTIAQFSAQTLAITAAKNIHKLAPTKKLRVTG